MKVLMLILAFNVVSADLIGYNRLGNNVNNHYTASFQKRSASNYLRQLQQFMDSKDNSQSETVKQFIKSNLKEEKPAKKQTRRMRRRSLYQTYMRL